MKKNVTFFICFTLIFLIPSITSSQEVKLVYDIKKGNQGSHPLSPVVFNGKLYFSAYQSKSRDKMELYVYDGFSSPRQIDNIILPDPPFYTNKIIFKQKLYFVAYDKDHGYELWVYDGLNPPSMVADTNPNQTKWGSSG